MRKFFIFQVLLLVVFSAFCCALSTRDIDAVRKKDILENSDIQIISDFTAEALSELIFTDEPSEIADIRGTIISRSKSENQQYLQAFTEAMAAAVDKGFDEADTLKDEKLVKRAKLNLLLLISELGSLNLTDQAMKYISSDQAAVRFLAVKSVTNEKVITEIKDTGTDGNAKSREILTALTSILSDETDSSIILEIAKFAASANGNQAKELLADIADKRMDMYRNWRIIDADMDGRILELTGEKASLSTSNSERAELTEKFAQLYSFVIQRYAKSYKTAGEDELGNMVTTLVAVENGVLGKMLGAQSSSIRKALEKKDMVALMSSHDLILGSADGKGALAKAMNFTYSHGDSSTDQPEKLSDIPKK